jgi:hypothetical protein
MSKRVTVIINDDFIKKLRQKQANQIKKEKSSISFSKILCDTIREGLTKS